MALAKAHKDLLSKWSKDGPNDITATEKNLKCLKTLLSDESAVSSLTPEALLTIHQDTLEIDALNTAAKGNLKEFDDAISQVMAFYASAPRHVSPNKNTMLGLNLMFLLASNRLSDFHVLLEQIGQQEQVNNPYISTPVKIEQAIMEGAYNKIVLTQKNIPTSYYSTFVQIIMNSVRTEIASNVEKSFSKLPFAEAQQLLLFNSADELTKFSRDRKWALENGAFTFKHEEKMDTGDSHRAALDTKRIARQTIFYAKQLEMIV